MDLGFIESSLILLSSQTLLINIFLKEYKSQINNLIKQSNSLRGKIDIIKP